MSLTMKQTRTHPQVSFKHTAIRRDTFHGELRAIYASKVLKTQLDHLKKQGSYDAFRGEWHPTYEVRRLHGAMARPDGIPPSSFWESDVAKWIEATCYFIAAPADDDSDQRDELWKHVEELVNMIEAFQKPDGYVGIYFSVVDPSGRMRNFRDMHELYNAGHMLEAALAHFHLTNSRQFLDVMIRNIDFWMSHLGREDGQIRAYCGHPEMELAVLRLYAVTGDERHLKFAEYLLSERGHKSLATNNQLFFRYEADTIRGDLIYHHQMENLDHMSYVQAHAPLHSQDDILGHSVRALYLLTAAADLGNEEFLEDAKRLWAACSDRKMYATGGIGTERRWEGFHQYDFRLPQSTEEGGGYAETCASIAGVMVCERLLSHTLDGKIRDDMELILLNGVIGGASLSGDQFNYHNVQATCGDETAIRADWFEVCCCPPNLSRTMGILGGYIWRSSVLDMVIRVDVYLFVSATRTIELPCGGCATVVQHTDMPWQGHTELTLNAPVDYTWEVNVPVPGYSSEIEISEEYGSLHPGFAHLSLPASTSFTIDFDLNVRFLASHPSSHQDTLVVRRGPIVYTAESVDNEILEELYPHFSGVGFSEETQFRERHSTIHGMSVVNLESQGGDIYGLREMSANIAYREVTRDRPARSWVPFDHKLILTPWFVRANKGGKGHIRTAFRRFAA